MDDEQFHTLMRRESDRICALILHTDLPWVDVAIQENQMRELCREYAPDRLDLFEMVYAARFRRLWETWRIANVGNGG
jgi:hypothetical protein